MKLDLPLKSDELLAPASTRRFCLLVSYEVMSERRQRRERATFQVPRLLGARLAYSQSSLDRVVDERADELRLSGTIRIPAWDERSADRSSIGEHKVDREDRLQRRLAWLERRFARDPPERDCLPTGVQGISDVLAGVP